MKDEKDGGLKYVPPEATRLDDSNMAHGACSPGSGATFGDACYRGNDAVGDCITGKTAAQGCHDGAGV